MNFTHNVSSTSLGLASKWRGLFIISSKEKKVPEKYMVIPHFWE